MMAGTPIFPMKPTHPARPGPPNHPKTFWAPWAKNMIPRPKRRSSKPKLTLFDAMNPLLLKDAFLGSVNLFHIKRLFPRKQLKFIGSGREGLSRCFMALGPGGSKLVSGFLKRYMSRRV